MYMYGEKYLPMHWLCFMPQQKQQQILRYTMYTCAPYLQQYTGLA